LRLDVGRADELSLLFRIVADEFSERASEPPRKGVIDP
jgi:hypothetical protein